MLAATHLVAGAGVGLAVDGHGRRTASALASHALLDCIAHDDTTITPPMQAVLGGLTLATLTATWGWRSPVVLGALAGASPDGEIALSLASGRRWPHLFPSHWPLRGRDSHPVEVPRGRRLPAGVELALTATALGLLCLEARRRR